MRRWVVPVVVAVVVGTAAVGWLLAWFRSMLTAELTVSVAEPQAPLWLQEAVRIPITLHNPNWRPVLVSEFRTTCNCTSVEPASVTVAPKGRCEVLATVRLIPSRHAWNDAGECSLSVDLQPVYVGSRFIQGKARRLTLPLRTAFEHPGMWKCEEPVVRGENVTFRTSYRLFGLWQEIRVVDRPRYGEGLAGVDAQQQRVTFQYSPRHDLPPGEYQDQIAVQPVRAGGEPLPVVVLPVSFSVVPSILFDPPAFTFIGRPEKQPKWSLYLKARRNNAFRICRVELPRSVAVDPPIEELLRSEARSEWRLDVSYPAPFTGSLNGNLIIETRSVGEPVTVETIAIPISIHGVSL
ncbi:MAG: hypothetical protein KatS3mg110_3556 [Pirellulaceae bacterium]|nr:MAG: hypothetical protein KatS3mg110_3556 [Pirellulaceae bacterium]